MARGSFLGLLGLLLIAFAACSGDDDDDSGEMGLGKSGSGASNDSGSGSDRAGSSGGKAGNGSSGSGTQSGGSGTTGSGGDDGEAGSDAAGSSGEQPDQDCDLDCDDGTHCELVQVTCIRAPCNPIPMCVGDEGDAGSSGGDAGSNAGSGELCGTRGTGDCTDGEDGDFPPGANCGRADAGGTCKPRGSGACTREYDPVCGCDGTTYGNPCNAAAAGVSVESQGECEEANAGGTVRCNDAVSCAIDPEPCPEGQVHSIVQGCYGECVGIEQCECAGPEDCPDNEQYTCHMFAGHCGPYV